MIKKRNLIFLSLLILGVLLISGCGGVVVPSTYTVTFNSQGGSAVSSQVVEEGELAIEPTAPTKAGYTFTSWYKEPGCINAWDFNIDTVISDVTLYAQWTAVAVEVGDSYGGGIVAYILQPGEFNGVYSYDANVQHGLIAATADQTPSDSGIQWYNGSFVETGATATALGTGLANTNTIISIQGEIATSYAAGLARAYKGGEYTDWFLPSKDELNKLYLNKGTIDGFADSNYWSSSEKLVGHAWGQSFVNGGQLVDSKLVTYQVRAVRAF